MALRTVRQANDEPMSLQILFSDPRLAVREDCIVCLICAAQLRQLTNTHLRGHGTGVAEYRARFGYNRRRALMCRALHRLYTERAVRAGLAARIGHRPIVETPELRRLGGVRPITLEEQLTRREAQRQSLAARLSRMGRRSSPARPALGSRPVSQPNPARRMTG